MRAYALAGDAVFASSQPVTSAFAQLASSRVFGSRRWGFCDVFRRGTTRTPVPGSARGDVLVPLADVWHPSDALEVSLSTVRPGPF